MPDHDRLAVVLEARGKQLRGLAASILNRYYAHPETGSSPDVQLEIATALAQRLLGTTLLAVADDLRKETGSV